VHGIVPGLFLPVRTFTPKNSKKIAAKVGKIAPCRRFHDDGSAGLPKLIRPIMCRSYGLKFFPGKNFWFESWYGRIFFAAKVFRPYFFRFEIKKIQKNSGRRFVRPDFSGWKSKLPGNFWSKRSLR